MIRHIMVLLGSAMLVRAVALHAETAQEGAQ